MKKDKWRLKRIAGILPLVIGLWIFLAGLTAPVKAASWQVGDVFVGVSSGSYRVYDNNGVFKETISDGLGGFTTGCAFNNALDKFYTTNFSRNFVEVYDVTHPHNILQTINTTGAGTAANESILFDNAGNFFVGHADGNRDIHKYDAAGNFLDTFDVVTERRGSDWIDLSSDQHTMFYTSEGALVKRYDVASKTQLADFANTGASICYALRLLPPGDGSGGLLVAATGDIRRLDGSGNVIQTYDVTGENQWFALNLDPNGTSFWSGSFDTANFYRFNIATGAIEVGPINTGTGGSTLFGICVAGEITVAKGESIQLTPLSATNPLGTQHTVNARVQDGDGNPLAGVVVTFTVISGPHTGIAGNDTTDANGQAAFTYTGTGSTTGTDTLEASFINNHGDTKTSNQVTKTWEATGACNLEAHYPLDEGSGNIAGDASGNGNDGTISGATWTTGKINGALSFDGIDDNVSAPVVNNDEMSISLWFFRNEVDTQKPDGLFGAMRWNADVQLREGFALKFERNFPETLNFRLTTQDHSGNRVHKTCSFKFSDSTEEWFHVVGTYNSQTGEQKLYIDGELKRTRLHPAGNTVVPLTFYSEMTIGLSGPNGHFNGIIDDVRLYCRPLSEQEIEDLYDE